MPSWPSIRNMSHSQQHPLLIPRLHLSTCLFWLLKAFDSIVLISCFVAQEKVDNFLFLLQGVDLSLFVVCKSNMLLRHLRGIVKFMIALNFLVLASNNLVECILAQPRVSLFLSYKQTQESRKCNKFRNLVMACSRNASLE